jgi:hypothetical protein
MEKIMTKSTRIALAAALLVGGATIATAQNGPPTGGYPPARWNPNLYGYYGYHHHHYGYHHRYYHHSTMPTILATTITVAGIATKRNFEAA